MLMVNTIKLHTALTIVLVTRILDKYFFNGIDCVTNSIKIFHGIESVYQSNKIL